MSRAHLVLGLVSVGLCWMRSQVWRVWLIAAGLLLAGTGTAVAQEAAWPDFSTIKPLDVELPTLDKMRRSALGARAATEPGGAGDGLPIARSMSNSSGAPVVCDGPYIIEATDDYCWELALNENYLAILTTRDGPTAATDDDVQAWLDQVGGNFQLAWTSTPVPSQPNASVPRIPITNSTPNATNAPADFHVFFRPFAGVGMERMIDSLVRSRLDDWFFSPMFRWSYKDRQTSEQANHHLIMEPRSWAYAPAWPASDFRQLMPALQAAAGNATRIERVTHRTSLVEFFEIYPADRNGLSQLTLVEALETVPNVTAGFRAGGFLLPGDTPSIGGPSGGPSGGGGPGATGVPLSSPQGQALMALVLALYWMRRS